VVDLADSQRSQFAPSQPGVGGELRHQLIHLWPALGQGLAELGDIGVPGDLGGIDEQGRLPGHGHLRHGRGAVPPGLPVHLLQPGAGQVSAADTSPDQRRDQGMEPAAFLCRRGGVDDSLHVGDPDVLASQAADDRGHESLAQPPLSVGVLAGPLLVGGSRSGDRYQAIRSAPDRSILGASASSRSVIFASRAASFASVTASQYRRRPSSIQTARHRPPFSCGG
jgi:hypothetical protein